MRSIKVESKLAYEISSPTSFVFNIAAAENEHQKVLDEQLVVTPEVEYKWCRLNDFGMRGIRLNIAEGVLEIHYRATVQLRPEVAPPGQLAEVDFKTLPTAALTYLNPSRYCESDRLMQFAQKEFADLPAGYFRVQAICDWVHEQIDYVAGSTNSSSSACDVLLQRAGVCRDFAHVSIALCRALGIPARYVSGYAAQLQPPDFHGFFEAYLEQNWYLFDATRMAPVSGLVRVGMGRDAADSSFASIVGEASLKQMEVSAEAVDGEVSSASVNAISTA